MNNKITFITPPDIFENDNPSILFLHLNEDEQEAVSKWLNTLDFDQDINFYVYDTEDNIPWIFYAMSVCQHKYLNLDGKTVVTDALAGYLLGKSGVHYKTSDPNLVSIYSNINNNNVDCVETFLERILIGQRT